MTGNDQKQIIRYAIAALPGLARFHQGLDSKAIAESAFEIAFAMLAEENRLKQTGRIV